MQQHIRNTIVNALDEQGLGHYRSTYGVDDAIDKVSETLATSLNTAVEAFLDEVESRDSDLVGQARDLFVSVGLTEASVPEVDEEEVDERTEAIVKAKADLNEWLEKGTAVLGEVRDLLARI